MQPIYEVRDYLIEKVRTVNTKNPKANTGAVILQYDKDYVNNMEGFVKSSLHTIQILFTTSSSSNPVGTASLTNKALASQRQAHSQRKGIGTAATCRSSGYGKPFPAIKKHCSERLCI